jgi:hypothetical protein
MAARIWESVKKMILSPPEPSSFFYVGGIMYQFKEIEESEQHFWFDKNFISNMNWGNLPKDSKSIYPVIASHRNVQGHSFPSEQTIGILSGVTEKTVRQGICGLRNFPGFLIETYTTRTGNRGKKFKVASPEHGKAFPFYKTIITGGNWMMISTAARALYPVLRVFGYFDRDSIEDDSIIHTDADFQDCYKSRDFDFCKSEIQMLSFYAGISRRSFTKAIESLEINALLEKDDSGKGLKVFLHATRHYHILRLNYISTKKFAGKMQWEKITGGNAKNGKILPTK